MDILRFFDLDSELVKVIIEEGLNVIKEREGKEGEVTIGGSGVLTDELQIINYLKQEEKGYA